MPGPRVPFPPQEAEQVEALPTRGEWQYEPKWDGFRGVLENDGGPLALWSRNGRPLLRYFPELAALGDRLPPHSALDGEIVIASGGRLDFDALQMRLHPAESRIRRLAKETPAEYVVFDVLLWDGEPVHARPLAERRAFLERTVKGFRVSAMTRDVDAARAWLERLEVAGLDGVIAKRRDSPYVPGSRDAVVKVKRHKTVDCVVVGFRWSATAERRISTLLLGLYREDGTLDFVGHAASLPEAIQARVQELLLPLQEEGHLTEGRAPGGESRWSRGKELEWVEVRPEVVVEVRVDKIEDERFRHGTRFLRFRPDKDARRCTWDQVRPRRGPGDPSVESLLRPER